MAFNYKDWRYVPEYSEDGKEYTWDDVLDIARGNECLAKEIICLCEWQFPETVLEELIQEEEVVERDGKYIQCYDDKQLESLWEEFGDILIAYNDEYPDGILENDWFIFKAGTEKIDIWHWFDDRYTGGVIALMLH